MSEELFDDYVARKLEKAYGAGLGSRHQAGHADARLRQLPAWIAMRVTRFRRWHSIPCTLCSSVTDEPGADGRSTPQEAEQGQAQAAKRPQAATGYKIVAKSCNPFCDYLG